MVPNRNDYIKMLGFIIEDAFVSAKCNCASCRCGAPCLGLCRGSSDIVVIEWD